LAAGLLGCCAQHGSCRSGAVATEPPPEAAKAVPAALEYPRFHPVPTRPVFLPETAEVPLAEVHSQPTEPSPGKNVPQATPLSSAAIQPQSAEPQVLTVLPNDGWRPVAK